MRSRQNLSTSYMHQSCSVSLDTMERIQLRFRMKTPPRKWSNRVGQEPNRRAVTTTTLQAIVPTTDLDGSDVSSFYLDSPKHERARVCMAVVTPKSQQPEDTSISTDEGISPFTSGDFASSPRTEAPMDTSPIPVRSGRNQRSENHGRRKFQVPKEPKKVRDEAQVAISAALDKVSDTIHFNRRGKRTMETLYVGNLEFKASTKDVKDVLDKVFRKIHVEDVAIPRKDGRSCGYAFVNLSWDNASDINPFDICKLYSGMLDVNSRPIYFRELDSKNDTQSSRTPEIRYACCCTGNQRTDRGSGPGHRKR